MLLCEHVVVVQHKSKDSIAYLPTWQSAWGGFIQEILGIELHLHSKDVIEYQAEFGNACAFL